MTTYVFDTNVFINLFRHYYQDRFPKKGARIKSLPPLQKIFKAP